MTTHAEQEQLLLTYFAKYRPILNIKQWGEAAGAGRDCLKHFLSETEPRSLSPDKLAKCLAYLRKQAQDLQQFSNY